MTPEEIREARENWQVTLRGPKCKRTPLIKRIDRSPLSAQRFCEIRELTAPLCSNPEWAEAHGLTPASAWNWSTEGVPEGGWAAVLRIHEEEPWWPIAPMVARRQEMGVVLRACAEVGKVAQMLGVHPVTARGWYRVWTVPGLRGDGRLLALCAWDLIEREVGAHEICRPTRRRPARGGGHGRAKLTRAQVREILTSEVPSREAARQYGCTHGHIRRIRRGEIWRHVWREVHG